MLVIGEIYFSAHGALDMEGTEWSSTWRSTYSYLPVNSRTRQANPKQNLFYSRARW